MSVNNESGNQAEKFWDGRYRRRKRVSSDGPNAILADVVGSLPPGTALDLGCGEGGDATWLAERGWRVTATDVSATALQRASVKASAAGVAERIDFQRHDLARTFPSGTFDLVSAHHLQSPIEFPRERVLKTASNAVAPGGLLLVVAHASVPPWSWAAPDTSFPTPEEALAELRLELDEWHSERVDTYEREATGPNGQSARVTDTVIALRRIAV